MKGTVNVDLMEVKMSELMKAGIPNPTEAAVKVISRKELLHHCRRRTREVAATVAAIESLLLSLSSATGTPLVCSS